MDGEPLSNATLENLLTYLWKMVEGFRTIANTS